MSKSLVGAVELPTNLMVRSDLFGQSFECRSGENSFTITLPVVPPDLTNEHHPSLTDPSEHPRDVRGPTQSFWGYVATDLAALGLENVVAYVGAFGFEASVKTEASEDAGRTVADAAVMVGQIFDQWFAIAADWIELWTGQPLIRERADGLRSSGQAWDIETGQRTGWGHGGVAYAIGQDAALGRESFLAAVTVANAGTFPSDAWLLWLRASRTNDIRRRAIDAGTAVEVGLARALHTRLSDLPEEARERIIVDCNGMVGMIRLLEDIDGVATEDSCWKRVANRIAQPRNVAAHRGFVEPGSADQLMSEAKAVLEMVDPLPLAD